MQKILLVSTLSLICLNAIAQNDYTPPSGQTSTINTHTGDKKYSIDVNIGAGIPMGDYGNTSQVPLPANDTGHVNGLALTGFHFNFTASYLFSQFFGGTLMIGGTSNSFDNTAWQTLRDESVPGITTSVNGNFYIGQCLIGPFASIPASNKVKIEFRALLGLVTANYPLITQTYPYYYYGASVTEIKSIKSSDGFGYYFGARLNYKVTDNIGLDFTIGYTGSDICYPEVDVTYNESGYLPFTEYSVYNRYMQLGLLQMTGGISYNW